MKAATRSSLTLILTSFVSLLLAAAAMPALAQTTQPAARPGRPVPQIDRVLVVSMDGLRPDVMLRGRTPTLHRLFENGAFSFYAQTVPVAITLPSHTSMMTGVSVERHGITWNDDRNVRRPVYSRVPTLFELAKAAGMSTALVAGKAKFNALAKPGTVDWWYGPDAAKTTDLDVLNAAIGIFREHKPQVAMVHFPGGDTAGHASGWGSREQFAAIEQIDEHLGKLLEAMDSADVLASTFLIISADHGGSGKNHGANDPRSLVIPWIASGPGIRRNFDLTNIRNMTINTTDTFATVCYVLGLNPPDGIEGKPIVQIFEQGELLQETGSPRPRAANN